jgi:hypothetical protein
MFDLSQMYMPMVVEAHAKKWIAVYRITGDSDDGTFYMAAEQNGDNEGRVVVPAALHLICVPHDEKTLEARRKAKEKKDAPSP